MFGIIEVDIYRVDDSKRSEVRDQVSLELGPPNPTIVIEEDGDEGKLAVQDILEPLRQYGTIVLVRYVQRGLVLEVLSIVMMLSYLLTWQSDSGLYLGDL